jgi:hypothetical protein
MIQLPILHRQFPITPKSGLAFITDQGRSSSSEAAQEKEAAYPNQRTK